MGSLVALALLLTSAANDLTPAGAVSSSAPAEGPVAPAARIASAYRMVGSDGGVFAFGNATFEGSTGSIALNQPIVSMASIPTDKGYWLLAADGGVFSFGGATFHGSLAGAATAPAVGIAAFQTGGGYWIGLADGSVTALQGGSRTQIASPRALNRPVVGIAATRDSGFWTVASDGGVFAFGDAAFYGSTGAMTLNQPVVGIAATPSGLGYWLVAADGGVFTFGDAAFYGSLGALRLNRPVVGVTATQFSSAPATGLLLRRGPHGDLFVLSADGTSIGRVFFPAPYGGGDVPRGAGDHAALSPDGTRVAVEAAHTKYGGSYLSVDRVAGVSSALEFGPTSPSISRDGHLEARARFGRWSASGIPPRGRLEVRADGGPWNCIAECVEFTAAIDGTTWSPDGTAVAYGLDVDSDDAGFQIVVVGRDGSGRMAIGAGRDPAWSPDGTRIAYVLDNDDGTSDIWVVSPDGTDARRFISGGRNESPTWSPDGTMLAFNGDRGGLRTAFVASADATMIRPITGHPDDAVLDWR